MSDKKKGISVSFEKLKLKDGKTLADLLGKSAEAEINEVEQTEGADELGKDLRIVDGKVLIKFPKFVHLIVMHNFESVMEKHEDQDIVITTDLLVDLANAHDDVEATLPWGYIILGVMFGVVVAVFLMQTFI